MNKEIYKKFTQIEHVLNKPSMYIGSIDNINTKQLLYENNQIISKNILYNAGLYKIIDELIVNSYDQSLRDNTLDLISVNITNNSFSIFNSGIGIPIEKHTEYKIYIPELIFANLLTSSNYDINQQKITGGTHGIGAKTTNIFSKIFIIEIWTKKKYYKQIFENNLSKINKPVIQNNTFNKTGINIYCQPDFNKFNLDSFSDDMINLIKRRVIDLTILVNNKVKIQLNNQIYENGFENYLNLYKNNNKWFISYCIKNIYWFFAIRLNSDPLYDTNIAFINGVNTNYGSHIDYIFDLLVPKFQKLININITKRFLKDNLTLCLVSSIINPVFNSQTKEQLIMPIDKFGFSCIISNTFWDNIKNSELIDQLKNIYSKQDLKLLTKFESSIKKNKIKGIPKLDDANYAGTKKSINCTLILTEGDSAKASAIAGIGALKDGRNLFGVYPLRGKLLNVREATTTQITSNQEILDIKKILGLKTGIIYNSDNIDNLRYGSILIMCDADEDGTHIKGLIINYFSYFFPSLLEIDGFIKILVTPIVKITKGNEILSFSNLRLFNEWNKNNSLLGYKIKYYKGLGTSTSNEAKEYFLNLINNTISIINKNNNSDILLAFSKEKINDRKKWLINYNSHNILQITPPTKITIHDFIHKEFIHFSNFDNIRSIPSIIDGFKPSQRKVLYASFKKNLKYEIKVAQLASYTAEITAYHHGEQSLVQTIINMGHSFIGSNNINLLLDIGQFGTRLLGGKDSASGRYIFTQLNNIVDKIFIKDDNYILTYNYDDQNQIEPIFYIPIIPTILINGCEGIGTGFSTYIPNYNLNDIKFWFINKLTNKKNKLLEPYYNNFKGKIIKYDDYTYISEGICEIIENNKIKISELPIKYWTSNYHEFLEELIETKNSPIKTYTNFSTDTEVLFILKINNEHIDYIKQLYETFDDHNLNNLYKFLKLYKTIKLSNLTLYDTNNILKTYQNIEEICNEFYKFRLEFYEKRRLYLIKDIQEQILLLENQTKFIELVKSKPLIFNMEQDKLILFLESNKLKNIDNLINMSFKQLSKDNLDKLKLKIDQYKKDKKLLEQITIKDVWLRDLENL
jgi:DNA topoisomerase-2